VLAPQLSFSYNPADDEDDAIQLEDDVGDTPTNETEEPDDAPPGGEDPEEI
jgi:hypothetical protein